VLSTDPIFTGPGDLTTGIIYESFANVPEPATWALLTLAAAGVSGRGYYLRRRRLEAEGPCPADEN
jgi:hypothetical protein